MFVQNGERAWGREGKGKWGGRGRQGVSVKDNVMNEKIAITHI